ncbi:hypothetical protein T265_02060 [Opisthorchis viverrini]|uniref:LIM zinc-binding domain-containing protein n=1 Tax=Opisthorchis viverrini TaxID=6198 RepID=A0A075AIL3_OPIVI|nr:hypothetical protein T265_02060 [Opisthorchis viverrini]KER31834.1 hypothetical protein T265_02060 [Opisthorchis viverrini]
MLGYSSKGDVSDRVRLESIFRSRFSSPNIEDEYSYNLSYLISHNMFGSTTVTTQPNKHKDLGCRKVECRIHNNFSSVGKYISQLDDVPVKQLVEFNHDSSRNRHFLNGNGKCACAQREKEHYDEKDLFPSCRLRNKNHESGGTLERKQMARKAFVSAHQPSDSPYPGLHIYVTESPPRPFYEVMSSMQTHAQYPRKTVACDPIKSKPKPTTRQRRLSDKKPDPSVHERLPQSIKNMTSSCLEAKSIPSVASRIEALFSTMQLHDEYESSDSLNGKSFPVRDQGLAPNPVEETNEYCFTCCKRTYAVDRIVIGDRTYHKGCFRCTTCQRTLLPGTFASLDGVILCKPHYVEQFRRTGRYEVRKSSIFELPDQHEGPMTLESDSSSHSNSTGPRSLEKHSSMFRRISPFSLSSNRAGQANRFLLNHN